MEKIKKTAPDKSDLLKRWRNRKKENGSTRPGIPRRPEGAPAPLSAGQQRLWFLQQLYPGNPFYHYADAFRIKGPLDEKKFFKAFEAVAQNHDILRTTFHPANAHDPNAVNHQTIHEKAQVETTIRDLVHFPKGEKEKEAQRLAIAEARRPFDLENGPLTRLILLRLEAEEYFLVLVMHHIITDLGSMQVLRKEWAAAYRSLCDGRPPLLQRPPIQYADYAHWQRQQTIDPKQLDYWKNKLAGELPALQLPTDYVRPARPSFRGGYCEKKYPPALTRTLAALAKKSGVTMFVLMLAAYKTLLYRYTGQTDILIGTPFANRNRLEVENLIGFLNNTLVMRSQLRDEMTFVELLRVVYQTSMEAFANKDIPFETLVNTLKPDRSISTNPLFQTMFLFHHALPVPAFAPGLQMEHAPFDLGVAKFDLTLYLAESNGQLTTIFEYAKDLFQRSTVERMQGHLKTLLEAIAENPNQKMAELPLLTNDEKKRLLTDWNNTRRAAPQDVPIHYFIENQAREQPDKIAVAAQGQHLSYFDLNKKAEQLAARLQAIGVGKNVPVGLFTGRSVKMITGILAILKTGGAYLPIDPDYPKDRIAFLLEDAAVKIILAQPHLLDRLPATTAQVVSLDEKTHRSFVPEEVAPDDLAYIIYTSGSTGRPKGVQVTHRNLVHSTTARLHFYPQSPGTFLLLSSFSFDSSVAGIFWTLCSGGQLLLPPQHIEQDPDQLATLVFENKVTHTLLLPSLYSLLLQHAPAEKLTSLHTVIVAGEACPVGLPKRHFDKIPNASLFNEYGPTEATVWCTAFQILKEEATAPIPIGRPIPNTEIYILDKNKQPVPIGVPGELYVGGAGVTKGYLNRPQLTNQRFIAPPKWLNTQHFPQGPGTPKLYRTGDLARYRPDGQIEFLGRTDQQVKIRGYRIEPEEIKKVLEQLEEVGEAAVVVQTIQENGMEKNGIERLLEALLSLNPDEADRLLSSIEQLNTNP